MRVDGMVFNFCHGAGRGLPDAAGQCGRWGPEVGAGAGAGWGPEAGSQTLFWERMEVEGGGKGTGNVRVYEVRVVARRDGVGGGGGRFEVRELVWSTEGVVVASWPRGCSG